MKQTTKPTQIDVFYVLDFDRCLGRTEKFQALLEETITNEGVVDLGMIQYAHQEVKKTGGSFDTAAYVRQVLKDRRLDVNRIWGKIETDFVEAAKKEDMFEPGAKRLLEMLKTKDAHFGIVTFGGYDWQTAKLRAAGLLAVPYIVTSYKEKGRMIAGWQQKDKQFLIPEELSPSGALIAKKIVLVDDKPVSFEGIPPEVMGLCVSPTATPDRLSTLPASVEVVPSMTRVVEVLSRNN